MHTHAMFSANSQAPGRPAGRPGQKNLEGGGLHIQELHLTDAETPDRRDPASGRARFGRGMKS